MSSITTLPSFESIMALPLPTLALDSDYERMDIFTAASLNPVDLLQQCSGAWKDSDVNISNIHGWTPLMYASYLGHEEFCKVLLAKGANPEASNDKGQTPIMLAASCGSSDVVNILVKYSAKVNQQDQYGRSSLHYAVKYNQLKLIEILLEAKADPNLSDIEDMTPTLMACEIGNEHIVSNLLKFLGDADRVNKSGENGMALGCEHPKVMALLKSRGVGQILRQLELEKYVQNFTDHGVNTVGAFLKLTEKELEQMGITLFGPKKKILHFIKQQASDSGTSKVQHSRAIDGMEYMENCQSECAEGDSGNDETRASKALEKEVAQLRRLCAAQREEMRRQQEINVAVRQILSQTAEQSRRKCSECSTAGVTSEELEKMIRRVDQMNVQIGSYLIGQTQ